MTIKAVIFDIDGVLVVTSLKDVNRKNIFGKIEQLNKGCVLKLYETFKTHQKSAQESKET